MELDALAQLERVGEPVLADGVALGQHRDGPGARIEAVEPFVDVIGEGLGDARGRPVRVERRWLPEVADAKHAAALLGVGHADDGGGRERRGQRQDGENRQVSATLHEFLPAPNLRRRRRLVKRARDGRLVSSAPPEPVSAGRHLARAPLDGAEARVAEEVIGQRDGLHGLVPVAPGRDARVTRRGHVPDAERVRTPRR